MDTPVLFIVFNRPEITAQSFAAIRNSRPSRLYVAADGPRPERVDDEKLCKVTREIAVAVDWPCEVKTMFRKRNLGCKLACSSALSWFFKEEPEGIIIEDDCIPQPDFFTYCTELLRRYRNTPEVMLIGGSNYQYGKQHGVASYYFSLYPQIWGWAAWRSTWQLFDNDMHGLERYIKTRMREQIGHDGAFRAMMRKFMLVDQGIDNAWSFQLIYNIWRAGGLSIVPNVNLINNVGTVEDCAHPWRPNISHYCTVGSLKNIKHPDTVQRNMEADFFTSDLHATEYSGQDEAMMREGLKRINSADWASANILLDACTAFWGNEHAGFRLLRERLWESQKNAGLLEELEV